MKLSAIVPTHNRPAALLRCLETLQKQDVDPAAVEVIVVDDGSTADIAATVRQAAAAGPIAIRCEHQENAGLNTARNRGATASQGDVLAFLDDDTLVSPGWAAALLDAFGRFPCAGVAGRVELDVAGSLPRWMAARAYYLAEYDRGIESRWLEGGPGQGGDPLPVGANCAVRRSEFDRLGGFRDGLDRIGKSLVSNGDTEFFQRLREAGGRLRYEPDAQVVHCVPVERLNLRFFARRTYAQGLSDELMFTHAGTGFSWRRKLGLARFAFGGCHMLLNDLARRRGAINGVLEISYWAGRFAAHRRAPA